MDIRPHVAMWSALAFMAAAAPVAWLYGMRPAGWSRGDILALLQTVFSIAALGAALTIAVIEHVRLTRFDEKRRADIRRLALTFINDSLEELAVLEPNDCPAKFEAEHGAEAGKNYRNFVIRLASRFDQDAEVLAAVLPQVVHPTFASSLVNLRHLMLTGAGRQMLRSPVAGTIARHGEAKWIFTSLRTSLEEMRSRILG